MKGATTTLECTACGQRSAKWLGRCPACGGWNTFEEVPAAARAVGDRPAAQAVPVTAADMAESPRLPTGFPAVDRVLGGGLVAGSLCLLAGEPGIGKSTLLLQVANRIAREGTVLYASAEESVQQIALRARRLGCAHDRLLVLAEPSVEAVLLVTQQLAPRLVIADSVQAMVSDRVPAVPGTVTQVREVASQFAAVAKRDGPPVVLVGHVTKEGLVAGPKSLEHLVDVVLEFTGTSGHPFRSLRATKNRFGPALEMALLSMGDAGLDEVPNPSAALLADRRPGAVGSAVAAVLEGTTPLLVEVQALVARSPLATPRRVAQGVEAGRLALLLAVLEKRARLQLSERDVFLNVVGGVSVAEPALDLAAAAAILSSASDRPLADDLVMFGEVGLLGEVRTVGRTQERLREAHTLRFRRCALPASSAVAPPADLTLVPISHVDQLVDLLAG